MAEGLARTVAAKNRATRSIDYRKRISDHVAYGLLVYTGLHIFVTVGALKSGHGSVLPYLSLVLLLAAIIPACRWFEKRWEHLSDAQASDPALRPAFTRDTIAIWAGAIGLPLILTAACKSALTFF